MSRRTTSAYDAVWQCIKNHFPTFNPNKFLTDFEDPLQSSISDAFKDSDVTGCHFHFCQAVISFTRKQGINSKEDEYLNILRQILCVPLLPEQFIPRAVTKLSQTIKDLDSDVTKRNLLKIIKYIENVWIKIVKPSILSVFKSTDRTNNCVEAFHSQLNKAVGITHPGIWIFIEKLKEINFRYTKEHQSLLEGSRIRTSNTSKKNKKDAELKKLWEEFPLFPSDHELAQYLKRFAKTVKPIENQ
ncbi:hypothetical protein Avbf_16687, partial [Armadillidium vulgare]